MPEIDRSTVVAPAAGLPVRSGWVVAGTLAVTLFGGVALGSAAAWLIAPDSYLATFVGFLALPLVFGAGYQLWQGRIAALVMRRLGRGLVSALWQMVRRRKAQLPSLLPTEEDALWLIQRAMRAASAFTHVGLLVGLAAGGLVGLAAPSGRFWVASLCLFGLCASYGVLLTRLGRAGYLPPPSGE